MGKATDFKFGL